MIKDKKEKFNKRELEDKEKLQFEIPVFHLIVGGILLLVFIFVFLHGMISK